MDVIVTKKRYSGITRVAAAAALAVGLLAGNSKSSAQTAPEFDWSVTSGTGSNGAYTPAPFLTDANAASVASFLAARHSADPNAPLAVKIVGPISNSTVATVFGANQVNYVFADFEDGSALANTKTLVKQIKQSGASRNAFVGNFNLYPGAGSDATRPTGGSTGAPSFKKTFGNNDYANTKVTMSNEAAYPGSPDYALPGHGTTAPNIRSALFVLPVDRVTFATDFLTIGSYPAVNTPAVSPGAFQNIPWVSRFNNYGNQLLNNAPNFQGYKFAFNTNDPNHPEYKNQLLSAGDFSAQVLQYRLRGASSFNLFNYSNPEITKPNETYSSVIGYTTSAEQSDATNGFTGGGNSTLNSIWSRSNYNFANLANVVPTSPNHVVSAVASGMVLSGIYDVAGPTRQLALLLSNMSNTANRVDFWQKYGGASVDLNGSTAALDQFYTVQPGMHQLLQFNLTGGKWVLFANDAVFADSNRNGIGVPEPTSLALLALSGAGLLVRRRNRI